MRRLFLVLIGFAIACGTEPADEPTDAGEDSQSSQDAEVRADGVGSLDASTDAGRDAAEGSVDSATDIPLAEDRIPVSDTSHSVTTILDGDAPASDFLPGAIPADLSTCLGL